MQKAENVVTVKSILEIGTARARQRKMSQSSPKADIETSWMMIPAIMMCVPGLVFPGGSSDPALDALAPPTAWMMIEIRSKDTKMARYNRAEMRL